MDFLSLTNNKAYNLSNIQAGIKIDSNNWFLKHYAGADNIFDAAELQKLQEDLGEYLKDQILDKNEAIAIYAKVLGTTIEKVKEFFAKEGKTEDDIAEMINASLDSLEEAEAHRECIEFLKNLTVNSTTSMLTRGNGDISVLYDQIKEKWGSILTPNQIYNLIFREVFTAEILEDAENGVLTKNDYIERKINVTKALYMQKIMTEYFDIEFADLKNSIPKEELEGVISRYFDQYFYNLVQTGSNKYDSEQGGMYDATAEMINLQVEQLLGNEELERKFFKKVSYEIKEDIAELISKQNSTEKNYDLSLLYVVPKIGFEENELLNFNQAFKLERGKDFNISEFEEFQTAQKNLNIIMGLNNQVVEVLSQIDMLMQKYEESCTKHMQGDYVSSGSSTMQGEYIDYTKNVPDAKARVPEIAQVLTQLHHGSVENTLVDLSKIIAENDRLKGLKLSLTEDGELDIQFDENLFDDTKRNEALNNLLTTYKNQVSSRFEKMLGEKSLDEYVNDFNSARNKAIGCPDMRGLSEQYLQDNGTIIDRTAGGVKTTGMYMMIAGGILVWIPPVSGVGAGLAGVGKWMAMGGMAAEYGAKYTEAKTSDTTTDEDWDNLNKHFIMDAAGMIIGFKAGSSGIKAFQRVIDKEVAAILKTEISSGNSLNALKTVIQNKTMRANLLEAISSKCKTDLFISYIGDLALDGILDIEDQDWLSLLEANAIGLLIGSSGDIADAGKMGADGFRLKKLRAQQANGIKLTDAELKELEVLEKKLAAVNNNNTTNIDSNIDKTNKIDNKADNNTPSETVKNKIYNTAEPQSRSGIVDIFREEIGKLKMFSDSEIETIINKFSDDEIEKLVNFEADIIINYKNFGFDFDECCPQIANTLKHVMNNIDKENWDIVFEMFRFESTAEQLSDADLAPNPLISSYSNSYIDNDQLKIVKALMDISKNEDRYYMRNIIDIVEYSDILKKLGYNADDTVNAFNMREPNGYYVIDELFLSTNYFVNFSRINLNLHPEQIAECRQKVKGAYPDISEKQLENIMAVLTTRQGQICLDAVLNLKDSVSGKTLISPENLELTIKHITNEDISGGQNFITRLIEIVGQTTDSVEEVNSMYGKILSSINNRKTAMYALKLVAPEYTLGLKDIVGYIENAKALDPSDIATLIEVVGIQNWKHIIPYLNNKNAIELYKKMDKINYAQKATNAPDSYTPYDIPAVLSMTKRIAGVFGYYDSKNVDTLYKMIADAVDDKVSAGVIRIIDDLVCRKQDFALVQAVIELGTIKDSTGSLRFSETALTKIINAYGGYGNLDVNFIKHIHKAAEEYPNMTTQQIIDHVKGKDVYIVNTYEYPLGDNGKFKSYRERIYNSKAWKDLDFPEQQKLFNYLTKLVNQDENRFVKLVESGYFELCSEGKLNINDLIDNVNTNKFFSKHFLNDVKRLYSGEPLVKEFPAGTKLSDIAKNVDEGEVASVDGKIYVNDNGQMVKLNMTKEAFEKLFPLESRFNTKQGGLGDCWLVSALDNLMDLPSGRAKIYQLFEQNGNEITVKLPHTQEIYDSVVVKNDKGEDEIQLSSTPRYVTNTYSVTFNLSDKISYKHNAHISGCQGLQMIEAAYAFAKAEGPTKELYAQDVLGILDDDNQMQVLKGGWSEWFFNDIMGYRMDKNHTAYDAEGNIVGESHKINNSNDLSSVTDLLERVGNDDNVLCYFSTKHISNADSKSRREKTLSSDYDLYSNHAYAIKGYDAERGLVYFTNPWNSNCIVEMDIYNFIEYIDDISYTRLS